MGYREGAMGPTVERAQCRRSPEIIARDSAWTQSRRGLDARWYVFLP